MSNDAFISPRVLALLGSFQAVDAVLCVQPVPYVAKCLDDVHYPQHNRWIFAPIKAASALGLIGGIRFPWLAKLTLIMLTVYFSLAVGAHVRARDIGLNAMSASTLLTTYGVLAARGLAAKSS
ncbi:MULTISPECIES: DoxX family protein [unclassified Mycobacterium]|uniref:DoxX family protein n=1 Tax=unclassified Mycobacterium TaxID=2642494 RepID=UPI0009933ECE|nr:MULTISPECIES: DoxX family protein [unclassified Mycobacterium]